MNNVDFCEKEYEIIWSILYQLKTIKNSNGKIG